MGRLALFLFAFAVAGYAQRPSVYACGGFFCGRMPVDQTAERIVFKVNPNSTTMIVQVAYNGEAADFAWVLPLGAVPDVSSLAVFPQRALTALDANTGPQFQPPPECQTFDRLAGAASPSAASDGSAPPTTPGVTVHYRAEVGPYDVAAIESEDPMALYDWLVANEFNVNDVMLPYIEAYTNEGMKFVALKLQKEANVTDIQPFQFDLPGTSPSIPLRMTALAAEPEMGVLVFVFADGRYNGANWPAIEIADNRIVWRANTWPAQTNWTALVARGVDEAGGQGWVTELAGSTEPILTALSNSFFNSPEDEAAAMELRSLIGNATHVSRLYSRLSAEEMTLDPIFHRDASGDVSNVRMLSRIVDGVDMCPDNGQPVSTDPCLFTSCGAGGICRPVLADGMTVPVAGCGCLADATARTTFDPVAVSLQADGTAVPAATVVCQDARLSFVNPGDTAAGGGAMEDPCLAFDCGADGECLAINMTPTCICDQGFVAIGNFGVDGKRSTRCLQPMNPVPPEFYGQRLPDLPQDLPGGRTVEGGRPSLPVVQPSMDDLGSLGAPLPGQGGTIGRPLPGAAPNGGGGSSGDGGCSVRGVGPSAGTGLGLGLWVLGLLAFSRWRRRAG